VVKYFQDNRFTGLERPIEFLSQIGKFQVAIAVENIVLMPSGYD